MVSICRFGYLRQTCIVLCGKSVFYSPLYQPLNPTFAVPVLQVRSYVPSTFRRRLISARHGLRTNQSNQDEYDDVSIEDFDVSISKKFPPQNNSNRHLTDQFPDNRTDIRKNNSNNNGNFKNGGSFARDNQGSRFSNRAHSGISTTTMKKGSRISNDNNDVNSKNSNRGQFNNEILEALTQIGVNQMEKRSLRAAQFKDICALNYDLDVKPLVSFLQDKVGLPIKKLQGSGHTIGTYLTKNPFILLLPIEGLQAHVDYLESKKFSPEAIKSILQKAVLWLSLDVKKVDERLGVFQKEFCLSGDEVRKMVIKAPKLVTLGALHVKTFAINLKDQLQCAPDETKHLLINYPEIFLEDCTKVLQTFSKLRSMGFCRAQVFNSPICLLRPIDNIRKRVELLKKHKMISIIEKLDSVDSVLISWKKLTGKFAVSPSTALLDVQN